MGAQDAESKDANVSFPNLGVPYNEDYNILGSI